MANDAGLVKKYQPPITPIVPLGRALVPPPNQVGVAPLNQVGAPQNQAAAVPQNQAAAVAPNAGDPLININVDFEDPLNA